MKNQKILFLVGTFLFATILLSCSKDDDKQSNTQQKKVMYKAIAEDGAKIKTIIYGSDDNATTLINQNLTEWSSEERTVSVGTVNAKINVQGTGTSASSRITVQIFVNGDKKAEQSGSGSPAIAAIANYNF